MAHTFEDMDKRLDFASEWWEKAKGGLSQTDPLRPHELGIQLVQAEALVSIARSLAILAKNSQ